MKKEKYGVLLLILKILHDLSILYYHNSQCLGYLGSCRIFSIHRTGVPGLNNPEQGLEPLLSLLSQNRAYVALDPKP